MQKLSALELAGVYMTVDAKSFQTMLSCDRNLPLQCCKPSRCLEGMK